MLEKVGLYHKSKSKRGSVQRFISNVTIRGGARIKPCIMCNDLDDYKKFMEKSLPDRRALIMEKGLCYACNGQGHRSRGCLKRRSCKICSGRHPTALHDKSYKPSKNKQVQREPGKNKIINSSTQTDNNKMWLV